MTCIQCLFFLENETVPTIAAGSRITRSRRPEERSAPLKYVLFPSKLKQNHLVHKILQQAGFQVVNNRTNIPENARFGFFVLSVTEQLLSEMEQHSEKLQYSFVDWLMRTHPYGGSAVDGENLLLIDKFLQHGADVCHFNTNECTLIHFAVALRDLALLKLLLARGVDINARGKAPGYGLSTALHVAVEEGSLEMVKLLVENRADLSVRNSDGSTPLHVAVRRRSRCLEIVKYLLDSGANVNVRSNDQQIRGATPLHLAILHGHAETVALLLERGANVNAECYSGRSALYLAVEPLFSYEKEVRLKIVENLVRYGPNVDQPSNKEALKLALREGRDEHQEMVLSMLRYGFDIGVEAAADSRLFFGAISQNLHQIVQKLLSFGATVDTTVDQLDWSVKPLHHAARFADGDMIQLLLNHGAGVNDGVENPYRKKAPKRTPLSVAIDSSNASAAKTLLANNANARSPRALLHSAVERCPDIVQLLLENGVNANEYDSKGRTPLHQAAVSSDGDMVELLLNFGANVNAPVKSSSPAQTPLAEAIKRSNVKTVRALLANSANFQEPPELLHAAVRTRPEIVQLLLENGADLNTRNAKGQTPISVAAYEGSPEVIDVFVKFGAPCHPKDIVLHRLINNLKSFQAFLDYGFADFDLSNGIFLFNRDINDDDDDYDDTYEFLFSHDDNNDDDDYDDGDCKYEYAARHVIKLEAAYGSVGSEIPAKLCTKLKLGKFKRNCEREIANMKRDVIGLTTVYNVLTKKTCQISCYARNEHFPQTSEAPGVEEKYPIYASVLECQIRKGTWRRQILNAGLKLLRSLSPRGRFTGLPDEIKERIVSYLSNQDVLILKSKMPNVEVNL